MFKSNLIAGIIGIAMVCGFLGTMAWWLKALPLTLIILGVIALMIYDFAKALKQINGAAGG